MKENELDYKERYDHYEATISCWIKDIDASILVVAGSYNDRDVFKKLGYSNVIISNLDTRLRDDEFSPFDWSFQDAENLTYPNNTFDYVVTHAALHHCYSPHRALLSMYAVARKGIIFFEARDSAIMRIASYFHFTQNYEHSAVFYNDMSYGGVKNTCVPNYIYRWTEREVEKTIRSFAPCVEPEIFYRYASDIPISLVLEKKGKAKHFLVKKLWFLFLLFVKIFPKQQNLFACFIKKPDKNTPLYAWLKYYNGEAVFNEKWGLKHYNQLS